LLKNEKNLLPLSKEIKSIAVIGSNANHERNQLGDYVVRKVLQDVVTVYEGVKSKVSPDTKVEYVKGCNVFKTDLNEISEAQRAAREADVAIVVVGENERYGKRGTDGEGCDVANLDLTGLQEDLVKAVFETGTPTIVVLINGRQLSIRWIAENIPAIVEAWICGEKGGHAVADVLFGDYNPAGRLPVTFPRHVGQLPVYYNCKPPKRSYVDMSSKPLFEFGDGLSYTEFEYSNIEIVPKPPAKMFGTSAEVLITVDVENVGGRKGDEIVQLYINDCLSSVVTPVKELKGFERITLEPAQKIKVEFTVTPYQLSVLDRNMECLVEPGTFEVMVGASSEDIRLQGSFEVKD
jgi:beta-glucosidase